MTDEAVAALWYYKIVYKESNNTDNILPLINFLLASEITRVNAMDLYSLLENETSRTCDELMSDEKEEDNDNERWVDYVVYDEEGKVILDKNMIEKFETLCGKPRRGAPVLAKTLSYFKPLSMK